MVFASLLTTVLLALAVAAEPIPVKRSLVTLPVSRRINVNSSVRNILQHDQLRAQALKSQGEAKAAGVIRQISTQVENQAVSYIASIGVGSPATTCKQLQQLVIDQTFTDILADDLIVDTGR
jgi:cathepsin E